MSLWNENYLKETELILINLLPPHLYFYNFIKDYLVDDIVWAL